MSRPRLSLFPLVLALALATPASAQDNPGSHAAAVAFPRGFDQMVYKGLVGNVLDAVPMDPSHRVALQRTNAVVSNTFLGRSLTILAGLSNPILMVGGFVWGLWAASNIKPVEAGTKLTADAPRLGGAAAPEGEVALLDRSFAADDAPVNSMHQPVLVSSISSADSDAAAVSSSHIVRIWLPQRSAVLSR